MARTSVLATVAVLASFGLASCGGSGASQEEIAAAERHGRRVKAEKEKERRLENAIHALKKEREQEKRRPEVATPAPSSTTASTPSSPSERSSCGGELEVGRGPGPEEIQGPAVPLVERDELGTARLDGGHPGAVLSFADL